MEIERASFADPWTEQMFSQSLQSSSCTGWAAEQGGELVGYSILGVVEEIAEILTIAVTPAVRRQGVGRRLLQVMLSTCRDRDVNELFLEVRESNRTAQAFYHHFGFALVGRRKNYYRHPEEYALILRCVVPGTDDRC